MRTMLVAALWLGGLASAAPIARAEEFVATLALDESSMLSFEDEEIYSIPSGSTIRFRFGTPVTDGPTVVSVRPSDVSMGPLTLTSSQEKLLFSLPDPATGLVTSEQDGSLVVEMKAIVNVTFVHPEGNSMTTIPIRFTTEAVEGRNLSSTTSVSVSGTRLNPSTRAVELVGTSTTSETGSPVPDAAVYVVLSGVFDQLPAVE